MAGSLVLAATPAAFAAPSTQSPEGIGIAATGLATVAPTPDATTATPNPSSVATVTVAGILNANVVSAQVSGNTTTAGVTSLDTTGLVGALLGTISAGVITSTCTANANGTFTESANVANLNILGATFNGTPGMNTSLGVTLPIGITAATVTLNEQVAGPVVGSVTVNAVHIHFTTLVATEDIYIASSTCGPFNASAPLAGGKGLAIGLGACGLLGLSVTAVGWHRRRRYTQA
ncbi:MAG TPA: choice-of-anchor P family protein [Streptosporangiaceae bacterium]|nr:choice-of-anchor P family protein [Streptosporangiaceae bacterium]